MIETGFEVDEEIVEQLRQMGAPPEVIEAAGRSVQEQEGFEVFEDCVQSVTIFRSVATQWRYRGMDGTPSGLDYGVLPGVMRMLGVPPRERKQVFEDVMTMEQETLRVIAERADK